MQTDSTALWQAKKVELPIGFQDVTTVEALELDVLRLPVADRERRLDRVIDSLDADKARDKAWDALAAQLDSAIDRGEFTPVSGPEAVACLRAELC